MDPVTPIFLFSLPRSGSTLVQRVLAADGRIATASEPWLLLPLLYWRKTGGLYAEYSHHLSRRALEDFVALLPQQEADYREAVRQFALGLYRKAAPPQATYFLDKTPRYHLVVADIMGLFPDARFLFLWRNPLAILASIIETWGGGRWNIYLFKVDLFKGLAGLIDAYRAAEGRAFAVRYEDLVEPGASVPWKALFEHLGLPYDPAVVHSFTSVRLEGSLGDPTGIRQYDHISVQPLEKWKQVLNNPLRKWWARRYLCWIGADRLRMIGYDLDTLLADLAAVPTSMRFLASDSIKMVQGALHPWVEAPIWRAKWRDSDRHERVAHG